MNPVKAAKRALLLLAFEHLRKRQAGPLFERERLAGWLRRASGRRMRPRAKPPHIRFPDFSSDSRQQKRRRAFEAAFAGVTEKFPGEPRDRRRRMAREWVRVHSREVLAR
jgi:hypothetical protein